MLELFSEKRSLSGVLVQVEVYQRGLISRKGATKSPFLDFIGIGYSFHQTSA
jgi:hypothetical protein